MLKFLKIPDIRKKILFTLAVVFVFRLLAHIPVPGVDSSALKNYLQGSTLLGLFDLFSGG